MRKGPTQLTGFNERIIALHAQDLTTQDIRAHLGEMYDAEVSPGPDLPGHRWRAGRAGRVAVPPTDQVYPVTLHRRPDGQEPRRGWCRTGPSTSLPQRCDSSGQPTIDLSGMYHDWAVGDPLSCGWLCRVL